MDKRRKYPFMGKARIHGMLGYRGVHLSVSTVGRILERALAAGAIRPASFCEGRLAPKRRRALASWAAVRLPRSSNPNRYLVQLEAT